MFLHPVNVRCLVREYGSLEQSPEKISAMVVEIAGYSMSEVRSSCRGGGSGSSINLMSLSWAYSTQVHKPSRPFSVLVVFFLFFFGITEVEIY